MKQLITLDPAQLHENGRPAVFVPFIASTPGAGGYWNVGSMARWKFTTTATSMDLRIFTNEAAGGSNNNNFPVIAYRVDDVNMWAGTSDLGDNWYYGIPLPGGAGVSKTVEVWVGTQGSAGGLSEPVGQYPISVAFNAPATYIAPVTTGNHRVIYGDSITDCASAIIPQLGFAGRMKRTVGNGGFNGRTTIIAHGYRQLAYDVSTATPAVYNSTKAAAFVAQIVALNPTEFYSMIGVNDWLNIWSSSGSGQVANFQAAATGFFGLLGAALPSVPIKVVSPLITTGREGVYTSGTMDQYRAALSAAVTAVGLSNVTFASGKTIISTSQIADDPHPATEGHATIRAWFPS